jgi:tripartite-type tricarboxylate transporter receptor subunit TctC
MRFMMSAGMQAVHVPFKGGPEAMNEIIAGRLDFFFAPVANALPLVKDGMLTALVVNSATRSAVLPDVPTTAEAGFRDAEYPFWIGLFLPAKTPRAIVDILHDEVAKALDTPNVRSKLKELGVDPMPMSPGEMDTFVRNEIIANATLVKAANIAAH